MEKSETERIKLILRVEFLEARIKVKDEALRDLLLFTKANVLTGWQSCEDSIPKAEQALAADEKDD